jgi:hypothetical protein
MRPYGLGSQSRMRLGMLRCTLAVQGTRNESWLKNTSPPRRRELVLTLLFEFDLNSGSAGGHEGAVRRQPFLRDGWNVMDFGIICLSWLSYVPGVGSGASALRALRLLLPLKLLTALPGMKVCVQAHWLGWGRMGMGGWGVQGVLPNSNNV